jgi:hypothetical protein
MKPSLGLRDLAGWFAVLAMLALSSPGVTIVKAEGGGQASVAVPPPGPACQADPETERVARRAVAVDLSRLAERNGAAGVVALGTGGYGYPQEPAANPGGASVHIGIEPVD